MRHQRKWGGGEGDKERRGKKLKVMTEYKECSYH